LPGPQTALKEDIMTKGNANNETPEGKQGKLAFLLSKVESNPGIVIMIVFCVGILYAIYRGLPVIDKLCEPSFARGLITFIICVATIGLAFMLTYYAFAKETTDDRFRRAREVFAGLLGVLGTIVGFYFGSANTGVLPISIADIQVSEPDRREIVTYITGGTPPYQCRMEVTGKFEGSDESRDTADLVSDNGWIKRTLKSPLLKAKIDLSVKDGQNRTASKVRAYEKPKAEQAQAAQAPSKQEAPAAKDKP
jgi:hypothetical protein